MGKQKRRRRGRKPFIFGERSEVDEKEKGRQLHENACLSSEQGKKEDNIESMETVWSLYYARSSGPFS